VCIQRILAASVGLLVQDVSERFANICCVCEPTRPVQLFGLAKIVALLFAELSRLYNPARPVDDTLLSLLLP
jgi:hypothetical protein